MLQRNSATGFVHGADVTIYAGSAAAIFMYPSGDHTTLVNLHAKFLQCLNDQLQNLQGASI